MKIILGLLLFFSSCTQPETVRVTFRDEKGGEHGSFKAEVASTNATREIGLMYRKEFTDDQAMIFVFPVEAERSFWMKNTYLELDMVFVDAAKKVVSIVERAIPLSETPRKSQGKAQYVVEIKGGLGKTLGIRPGMSMGVDGMLPVGTY